MSLVGSGTEKKILCSPSEWGCKLHCPATKQYFCTGRKHIYCRIKKHRARICIWVIYGRNDVASQGVSSPLCISKLQWINNQQWQSKTQLYL